MIYVHVCERDQSLRKALHKCVHFIERNKNPNGDNVQCAYLCVIFEMSSDLQSRWLTFIYIDIYLFRDFFLL